MPQAPEDICRTHHDDNDSVLLMLDSLLRSVGFNVRTYSSTQEFLKADILNALGCIVLDVRLRESMDGLSGRS